MEYYYKLGIMMCILLLILSMVVISKYRLNIIAFINQKRLISIGVGISLVIIGTYNYTAKWPELFYGGNTVYKIIHDLSLAYLGGVVFYVLETYIPEIERKEKFDRCIKRNIFSILENMIEPIDYMAKECLGDFDINNLLNSDCQYISDNFNTHETSKMVDDYGNHVIAIRYINEYIKRCEYYIDKMYTIMIIDLDYDLINMLEEIKNSSFYNMYTSMAEANTPKAIEEKKCNYIYEYYLLYKELKMYYDSLR